jgi:hypothetical protein
MINHQKRFFARAEMFFALFQARTRSPRMLPGGQMEQQSSRLPSPQPESRKLFLYGWKSLSFKWSLPSENNFSLASGLSGFSSSGSAGGGGGKVFLSPRSLSENLSIELRCLFKFFSLRRVFSFCFIPRQSSISAGPLPPGLPVISLVITKK